MSRLAPTLRFLTDEPRAIPQHFTGLIMSRIRRIINAAPGDDDAITIDNHQQNAMHGIHQARVRLAGDPTVYRLILAPADAPVEFGGRDAATYFARPLGEG